MHIFYVDVPTGYKYDWSVSSSPTEVLRIETGALIEFVCNSHARISDGDVYQVGVETEKDELFFLLKTGFSKMKTEVVAEYLKYRYRDTPAFRKLRA
jgi:hypothetical protein